MRQQLIDVLVFGLRQPGQDILDVGVRIMPVELGRLNQAHYGGQALAGGERTREEPILALCGDPHNRKNWLFCSSETGAKQLSTIQTVLATCRRHDVDPYAYLVDVLQRINELPASRVAELTPREWARQYAANPLRSDLAKFGQ